MNKILCGDALEMLKTLPDGCAQCCVTSPPYWGLRDYGVSGQIGLEPTPDEFVSRIVAVFREVRRVLRDDGTLWLNLGDTYNAYNGGAGPGSKISKTQTEQRPKLATGYGLQCKTLKPKDLIGIPWMVAFALRSDGWYLRQDIIWSKLNCMPESVTDRCTKSHEYLFLLSKSERYFYDLDAIREPYQETSIARAGRKSNPNEERAQAFPGQPSFRDRGEGTIKLKTLPTSHKGSHFNKGKTASHQLGRSSDCDRVEYAGRNRRSVWTVATQPFPGSHFATFPPKLIEPCILAGSRIGDLVLDPFMGAGTTAVVAKNLGRQYLGIELNAEYAQMAEERIRRECAQQNMFHAGGGK